ncbi:MAG: ABC-type transport auxiliary lipoprotein family protein [Desulfomicrobium sp.]|nr:ABC-type transport auxiliary lipoprotein family protein [Desulfomicrobium sp.]NLV96111.1 hypothetical protein [Desulfovibrionales bacterium]
MLRYPIGLCFVLLFLTGCTSSRVHIPDTRYYTLEYDSPEFSGAPLPVSITLNRFDVAPEFGTPKMIYRDLAFGRQEYAYHRWRATPPVLVQDYLRRDMIASKLFLAVNGPGSSVPSMYIVEGMVEEWMELDEEDGWLATAELTITLLNARVRHIPDLVIFQRQFKASEPCAKKNPGSVAESMSLVMSRLSAQIIADIHQAIVDHQDKL